MKRPIITAEMVQTLLADNAKQSDKTGTLPLPAGAVLTPSALDLVKVRGIALSRSTEAASPDNRADAGSDACPFAAVRKRVLEKLPSDLRASPLVDGLIRKAIKQKGGGAPHSVLGLESLAAETPSVDDKQQWRSVAGGILRIDSQCLPWQDFTGAGQKNAINIVDVIGTAENAPWGVGYLEWNGAGFDWELDYAEVDVVLEGELHITTQGETLKAKAGDVVFVPKGTALRFESPGYVKFVYVTWPANWNGA